MSDLFPARIITDTTGYIRDADAGASVLLNLSARALRDRSLLPFVITGRAELIDALRRVPHDGHPVRALAIRPREKRPVRILVELREHPDGVEWLISRGEPITIRRADKPREALLGPAVLVVDPIENTREQYRELVCKGGWPAAAVASCEGAYRLLEQVRFSAAVVDVLARTATGEGACQDMRRVLGRTVTLIGVTTDPSVVPREVLRDIDVLLDRQHVPDKLLPLIGELVHAPRGPESTPIQSR